MRTDFYTLLHDTARSKTLSKPGRPPRESEDGPLLAPRQSMRRAHSIGPYAGGAGVTLRTKPLKRFIAGRVGKAWDETYSMLCSTLVKRDKALTTLDHFLDVATKTSIVEGEVRVHCNMLGVVPLSRVCERYYVHPVTRLLCVTPTGSSLRWRWGKTKVEREKELQKKRRVINETTQLHLLEGNWFEVKFEALPSDEDLNNAQNTCIGEPGAVRALYALDRFDVIQGHRLTGRYYGGYAAVRRQLKGAYGVELYPASKRQLSHNELRDHGLL